MRQKQKQNVNQSVTITLPVKGRKRKSAPKKVNHDVQFQRSYVPPTFYAQSHAQQRPYEISHHEIRSLIQKELALNKIPIESDPPKGGKVPVLKETIIPVKAKRTRARTQAIPLETQSHSSSFPLHTAPSMQDIIDSDLTDSTSGELQTEESTDVDPLYDPREISSNSISPSLLNDYAGLTHLYRGNEEDGLSQSLGSGLTSQVNPLLHDQQNEEVALTGDILQAPRRRRRTNFELQKL